MLNNLDIKRIAKTRLKDSEVLFNAKRYDGSYYLCGYTIELGLKYRICNTLDWTDYPASKNEFNAGYQCFKTHNLDILLKLSGKEKIVKSKYLADWSNVKGWNPESRYKPIGTIKVTEAKLMLISSKVILKALL